MSLFAEFAKLRKAVAEATKDAAVIYLRSIGQNAYEMCMTKNITDKDYTLATGREYWLTEHPTFLHVYSEDNGTYHFWTGQGSYVKNKTNPEMTFDKEKLAIHFNGLLDSPKKFHTYISWFKQQYPAGLVDIQAEQDDVKKALGHG